MRSYSLREMTEGDLGWVLKARNSKAVRESSGNPVRIKRRDHLVWFDCSTASHRLIFTEDGVRLGVVIYGSDGYWSFYLDPNTKQNRGLGRLMLSLFLVYAKDMNIKAIKARVKHDNHKSCKMHSDLGFVLSNHQSSNFIELIKEL